MAVPILFTHVSSRARGNFGQRGDNWVRQKCRVSYVTGVSNWDWLTVGQGLLSLQQVGVEGECFYFFCFFPIIPVPLSTLFLSFISSTISFLAFSGRWHKNPQRLTSLDSNTINQYSLELPHQGNSNEYSQHTIIIWKIEKTSLNYIHLPPDLALWLTLSGSSYQCLEQIYMVPKMFETNFNNG